MRIGEVAEACGVNPTTIRYYESAGLLPEPQRTPSGYRDYDDATVARVSFIRAGQSIGLSLGEIMEILALRERGEAACPHVIELIEQHSAELEQRIASLEKMRGELVALAKRARRLPPRADAAFCHIIESTPAEAVRGEGEGGS